jgi:type III secretory pathway lipoprotein EscJ
MLLSYLISTVRTAQGQANSSTNVFATSASQDLALASPLVSMAGLPKRKTRSVSQAFPGTIAALYGASCNEDSSSGIIPEDDLTSTARSSPTVSAAKLVLAFAFAAA